MNLREKLIGYRTNDTILMLRSGTFGRVEEVGDDYIIFRQIIIGEKEGWLGDTQCEYSGTRLDTIPFAHLQFTVHPNQGWAKERLAEAASNESNESKKGSCFIATQVYGENAEETNLLRRFRDEKLRKTCPRRFLVEIYYRTSPSIAYFISNKPRLKKMVRRPLDMIVKQLRNT